jgi:TrwC relaxase
MASCRWTRSGSRRRCSANTSRTVDPQLHSYANAIISAKVQDRSGQWLALDARFLKYQQRSIGWVYDAALRAELTARLGAMHVERRLQWLAHTPSWRHPWCLPSTGRSTRASLLQR